MEAPITTLGKAIDIPTTTALLTACTAVKDLAFSLVHERDAQKFAAIKLNFTERLFELQARANELLCEVTEQRLRIATLEQDVRELSTKKLEHQRYHLAQIIPGGSFAYRLKPSTELNERINEPPHFVCQPCFDRGVKAVLLRALRWGTWEYTCPVCNTLIHGEHDSSE